MPLHEPHRARQAVALTRAGMIWEALAIAFWPLGVVLALTLAALAFGALDGLGPRGLLVVMAVAAVLVLAAGGWGVWRFRRPGMAAARARVDARLAGRPLSAIRDHLVLGAGDDGAVALWHAHLVRMQDEAARARAVAPDARLRWRDPVGLRLVGMIALAMTLIFAPQGRLGDSVAALAASFRPAPDLRPPIADAPSWEGWAAPPDYTRRPTIYLNALADGEALTLPKGSRISLRLYGEGIEVAQDIGARVAGGEATAPEFIAERDGAMTVAGRQFTVHVLPDAPPQVSPGDAPDRRVDGRLVQAFSAHDDNGVASGKAVVALDLAAVDRRFGLAVDPEPREAVTLDLPMPASGDRKLVRGRLAADLSRHPWANLPVTLSLSVEDGIAQQGAAAPMALILPGRRFFDPLAAALIELRRDLLWSRENAGRGAQVLRAAIWQPDGFMDPTLAAGLRGAVATLEAGDLSDEARNALAQVLWDAAVALEDGGLADALQRMRQAQERLSEAIRNGASPDEIQRLMDELRAATDAYTDMLAQQQGSDPSERFDRAPRQDGQQISGDQIQQMMDEIQRLMNEGRMAEAQELLDQFNRMMENLEVTQSEGGEGGRQRPMNRLAETLRDQQDLADEAMRQMQDQYGQWQPGQDGQPSPENQDLADRQRDLREDLGRQRGLMPGRGTPQGDEARSQIDEAGRAMDEAEQALRDGDAAGAMQRQAQAIQSMREGMRALGDMAAQDGQQGQDGAPQPGQQEGGPEGPSGQSQGQRGLAQPYDGTPPRDPLGRSLSGDGNALSGGDPLAEGVDPSRRARDLQDEIRRRSGERDRPRDERDYLGRLLDDF